MKKATVSLIGTLLVIMLSNNAGAHPSSGLRLDLGGSGFGFSIYNGPSVVSPFWYNNYRPYPFYSGYYPNRPFPGWRGYRGHHHHQHWGHSGPRHHYKNRYYGPQRNYPRGGYGHHRGNQHRHGHKGRQWRR